MKTKGKYFQIRCRDSKTGEEGWINSYNLFKSFLECIRDQQIEDLEKAKK